MILREILKFSPAKIIPPFLTFIVSVLLTNFLSPRDYAQYSLVLTTIAAIIAFFYSGIYSGTLRFGPRIGISQTNNIVLTTTTCISIFLVICALIINVTSLFPQQFITLINYIICAAIVGGMSEIPITYMRIQNQYVIYNLLVIGRPLLYVIILSVLIFLFELSVITVLLASIISSFLFSIIYVVKYYKTGYIKTSLNNPSLNPFLRFSFFSAISNLTIILSSQGYKFILYYFLSPSDVAIFAANFEIADKISALFISLFLLATSQKAYHLDKLDDTDVVISYINEIHSFYVKNIVPLLVLLSLSFYLTYQLFLPIIYQNYPFISMAAFLNAILLGLVHRYTLMLGVKNDTQGIFLSLIISLIATTVLFVVAINFIDFQYLGFPLLLTNIFWIILAQYRLGDVGKKIQPQLRIILLIACIIFTSFSILRSVGLSSISVSVLGFISYLVWIVLINKVKTKP